MEENAINKILPYYSGKRILVTGASGYLAWNFVNSLKDTFCTIIRLSRNGDLPAVDGKAKVVDVCGNISEIEIWNKTVDTVDVIFHFAAQTSVPAADKNPVEDFKINVLPMLNMLQACRNKKVKPIIVFAGTVTEAGIPKTLPVSENCEDHPITVYDLHKLMVENYLKFYCGLEIVKGVTLRLSNVYGPGPRSSSSDRGVVNMMMYKAIKGEELTIFGKGDCLRDYVFIDDVISAFLVSPANIEKLNGRHFVVGSGKGYTISEAVKLIAEQTEVMLNKQVKIKHIVPPSEQPAIDSRNFVADVKQFSQSTGWQSCCSLSSGIRRTLDFFNMKS